jgi:tetratricopeptide (TPR) repeat protein
MSRGRRRDRVVRLAGVALICAFGLGSARGDLDRGDLAWAVRAEGEREGRPQVGPIAEAVAAYERALAAEPENVSARWRLLRSLHFQGEFVATDRKSAERSFDRGRQVAEVGLDLLALRLETGERSDRMAPETLRDRIAATNLPQSDVARLHFWAAIHWAASARTLGLLTAVRQGLVNRIQRYTLVAIALEPEYDEGGAYRLLGRLHAELPRVPFVSGWVDRDEAIPLVERAYAIAPENPGNRLLLALTLLDLAPDRRAEALDLLDAVRRLEPRPAMRIEDLSIRDEARRRFAAASLEGVG